MQLSGRTQGNLPVEAYTSPEWFEQEQGLLFSRVWQLGGFVEDIAESGDLITVQAGRNPLFVVRQPDGVPSFLRAPGGHLETLKFVEKFNRGEVLPVGTQSTVPFQPINTREKGNGAPRSIHS